MQDLMPASCLLSVDICMSSAFPRVNTHNGQANILVIFTPSKFGIDKTSSASVIEPFPDVM